MMTVDMTSFVIDMTAGLAPLFYMLVAALLVSTFGIIMARSTATNVDKDVGVPVKPEEHEEHHDGAMPEAA